MIQRILYNTVFVAALLNDLFGVQVRGGCMCAGPIVQAEMGICSATADVLENMMLQVPSLDVQFLFLIFFQGLRAPSPWCCAPVPALLQQVNAVKISFSSAIKVSYSFQYSYPERLLAVTLYFAI